MERCVVCRYPCKGSFVNKEDKDKCKFYPKEHMLGFATHLEDPNPHRKHDATSRMCVVCKEYHHYSKVTWWMGKGGYYPFCPECWQRHLFILENVPVDESGLTTSQKANFVHKELDLAKDATNRT